jgi:hypothetical protein
MFAATSRSDAPFFQSLESGAVHFSIILIVLILCSGCAYFVPAMDDSVTEKQEKEKKQQQKKERSSPQE